MNDTTMYQQLVGAWVKRGIGVASYEDMQERGDRVLEEVLELLQSGGYDFNRIPYMMDYVNSRPAGDPHQELGGVMVCLAAYAGSAGLNMETAQWDEYNRIVEKVELIAAKDERKKGMVFGTHLIPHSLILREFYRLTDPSKHIEAVARIKRIRCIWTIDGRCFIYDCGNSYVYFRCPNLDGRMQETQVTLDVPETVDV